MSANIAVRLALILSLLVVAVPSYSANDLFQSPRTYDSGDGDVPFSGAQSIAVGDVNGDHYPDLLVANLCNGCSHGLVGVLLGNGDGSFQGATSYPSGGWGAQTIATGDVDRDGRLDVVVGNVCSSLCLPGDPGGVGVLLGNGDGTFQPEQTYPSGDQPCFGTNGWLRLADINHDGELDIVVANRSDTAVLLGNGDGTFRPAQHHGSGADAIELADVNGDGNLDLLAGSYKNVAVLLGDGIGGFETMQSYYAGGKTVSAIVVKDVNADKKPDLLVANQCRGDISYCGGSGFIGVLLGNGDGTFMPAQSYRSGGLRAHSLGVMDANEDGFQDLVVSNTCLSPTNCNAGVVGVLLGNGDGTFQPVQRYNTGSPIAVFVTVDDVNADYKPDILVANLDAVSVLLGRFMTIITLHSSPNPAVYGQSVSLVANITSHAPTAPSGKVTLTNGRGWSRQLTLNGGAASATTRMLPAGLSTLTAVYYGDVESIKSRSVAVAQMVNRATSVTAIVSSVNPAIQGDPVTFTATVTSPTARVTGMVTFKAGGVVLGTIPLVGQKASFTTSELPSGKSWITATYDGNENFVSSKASMTQNVH